MSRSRPRTRLRRLPEKGLTDPAGIRAILDEAYLCHVGYLNEDLRPVVIPTLHVRDGDVLWLHGSTGSGLAGAVRRGSPLCIAVTLVDGIVIARSGFESSINYRSVVIHGEGRLLDGEEKRQALDRLVETLIPGRLTDLRAPSQRELRQTAVIAVPLREVSAKVSEGPPTDDEADLGSGVWAGVIPVVTRYGEPIPAPDLEPGVPVPDYLTGYRR